MKQGHTYIGLLLDRSGSMQALHAEAVMSLNKLIADQKKVPGTAHVKFAVFSTDYREVIKGLDIQEVREIKATDYEPEGHTALHYALGRLITSVGEDLNAMPEDQRPDKVVIAVMTDGEENYSYQAARRAFGSKESMPPWELEDIAKMIRHQKDVYKWDFLFLGANIDVQAEGAKLGVKALGYQTKGGGLSRGVSAASAYLGNQRMGNQADVDVMKASFSVDDNATRSVVERFETALKNADDKKSEKKDSQS